MLSVNQVVVYTKEFGPIIEAPKNESSFRTIPFPVEIARELKPYRLKQKEHRLNMGLKYINKDLVFCNEDGTPLDPRRVGKQVKSIISKAGLPTVLSLHCLRHTHATQLLRLGVHPKVVQYRLGHSTFQQKMDTYSHVIPQMQDIIVEQLSDLLSMKTATENSNDNLIK
ncbi:MAG: site-specific integrase [Veillonellales bacterium]